MSVKILSGVDATTSLHSSLSTGVLDYIPPSGTTNVVSISQISGLNTELTGIKANVLVNGYDDIVVLSAAPTIGSPVPLGAELGIDATTSIIYYADGAGNWRKATPSATTSTPVAPTSATGVTGLLITEYALGDHKHPAQTVSADANNNITIGTDGLHHYTGISPATTISPKSSDAIGLVGVSTTYAKSDHKHPAQTVSVDTGNSLIVGTDGLHFYKELLNNLIATVPPTVTNDSASNYSIGSVWVDTVANTVYTATKVTTGAAVWVQTGNVTNPLPPTAANAIPPASTDAIGAIGTLTTAFALQDHRHPTEAVSGDANNLLTIGTDGLHYANATTIMANAVSPAATGLTGTIGVVNQAAREDHRHPAQGVSAIANNNITIGTDGLHYMDAATIAGASTPLGNTLTGVVGVAIRAFSREDHTHPYQVISADVGNSLTVGTDGLHFAPSIVNEVIGNAGALIGAAPIGAQLGVNTVTGALYYVSGGNWSPSGGGAASTISVVPAGNITSITVQAAINELDTKKLAITGGTMTGTLNMNNQLLTNVALPFTTGVHAFSTTDYRSTTGGNSFLIATGSSPTSTTPTYSFVGSTTTGMYWNAGAIAFSIGGSDAMSISSTAIDTKNKKIINLSPPTVSGDAVNLGYINGLMTNRVLGVATGVSLTTAGTSTIYTVPIGKSHIITQIIILSVANTVGATPTDPVVSIGSGLSTNNVINGHTSNYRGISGAADMAVYITPDDSSVTPNSAEIISITVDTPAGHSTLTATVYIMGFEL